MSYQHAVVWIDHLHATVIDFSVDDQHVAVVEREGGQRQVHRKSGEPGPGKPAPDHHFYDEVAVVRELEAASTALRAEWGEPCD